MKLKFLKSKLIFWKNNSKRRPYNKHFTGTTFHATTSKPLYTTNPDKSTKNCACNSDKSTKIAHHDSYRYPPQKTGKAFKLDQRKTLIDNTNRSTILSRDENPTDTMGKDSSLDGACERSVQIDKNNSNHRTTSYKKTNEITRKNKLTVTVILEDSIVKDINRKYFILLM